MLLTNLLPLVPPNQLGTGDDVALHGLFQCRLGGALQIRQQCIQRIKFEKITVLAYRWARPFVAGMVPVVQSLQGSRREAFGSGSFGQTIAIRWNVIGN